MNIVEHCALRRLNDVPALRAASKTRHKANCGPASGAVRCRERKRPPRTHYARPWCFTSDLAQSSGVEVDVISHKRQRFCLGVLYDGPLTDNNALQLRCLVWGLTPCLPGMSMSLMPLRCLTTISSRTSTRPVTRRRSTTRLGPASAGVIRSSAAQRKVPYTCMYSIACKGKHEIHRTATIGRESLRRTFHGLQASLDHTPCACDR
jgi:hypothetical protein